MPVPGGLSQNLAEPVEFRHALSARSPPTKFPKIFKAPRESTNWQAKSALLPIPNHTSMMSVADSGDKICFGIYDS